MAVSTIKHSPHIEKGQVTLGAVGATSFATKAVTFDSPFSGTDYQIVATITKAVDRFANCTPIVIYQSSTGCNVGVYNVGNTATQTGMTVDWIAIGD